MLNIPRFFRRFKQMLTIHDVIAGRKVVIPREGITRVYGRHGQNVLLADPVRYSRAVRLTRPEPVGNPLTNPENGDMMSLQSPNPIDLSGE